ncbi:MAG TPA: tetratricopeptide repeat protein [candidate division Zixibacteria bacterium]|nr:tetratricopeptide repeat protein [candidate division Zixibacteria bacterium]
MWRNLIKVVGSGIVLVVILIAGVKLLMPKSTANVDAIETASRLHASGNYDRAIEIYEQLLTQGVNDSVVFYNLGNAYYSIGDIGRAVANYNRAAQLDPRDPDIKANLELARGQITEPFIENDPGFIGVLSKITDGWLSVNETAIVALSFWFLAGLLLIGIRYTRDRELRTGFQYATILVILLLLLAGLSLGSRLYVEQSHPEGVVVVPTIAVSSEPNDGFATDLNLSSEAEIRFIKTNGAWGRLATPGDSLQNWIPLDTVEMVAALSPGLSLFG